MNLLTQIPLERAKTQIDYHSQLLLIGSCFSENIGDKLNYFKFQTKQNPFGILFHPLAIEKLVERAVQNKTYTNEELFFQNESWHCFDAHSDLSDTSKEKLLEKLNNALKQTHEQLTKSSHIIITLGTAWVYWHKEHNQVVANCHKMPQREFTKKLLSVDQVFFSLQKTLAHIKTINTNVELLFTISPVRHLKDGFIENQRSKAHLVSAIHQLIESVDEVSHTSYFPSYELMMDELRDYRFYKADMVHPSQLAIDYIWEKFKEAWILEKAYPIMAEVETIQKGLKHKAFNPTSEQHQKFLKSIKVKIAYIQERYLFMDF